MIGIFIVLNSCAPGMVPTQTQQTVEGFLRNSPYVEVTVNNQLKRIWDALPTTTIVIANAEGLYVWIKYKNGILMTDGTKNTKPYEWKSKMTAINALAEMGYEIVTQNTVAHPYGNTNQYMLQKKLK